MKYVLPITDTYVGDWDDWCAIRELLQNATDAADASGKKPIMQYAKNRLTIASPGERLARRTMLLGATSKADNKNTRGQFGEGYKLALLVLCRQNRDVRILNGGETWMPSIERNPDFDNEPVLTITVAPSKDGDYYDGVKFIVDGFPDESWQVVESRWLPLVQHDAILGGVDQMGNIYVGGLFVVRNLRLLRGYNFAPRRLPLNRDRNIVGDFDICVQTSRLWEERAKTHPHEFYEMHKRNAADTEYAEYIPASAAQIVVREYEKEYGPGTVPVLNQKELEAVRSAGMNGQIVTRALCNVIKGVKSFVFHELRTPGGKVKAFFDKYADRLDLDIREDLEILVKESIGWR